MAIGLEINQPGTEATREALIQFSIATAEDGISLLVREKSTDKIVGSVSNKIQVQLYHVKSKLLNLTEISSGEA